MKRLIQAAWVIARRDFTAVIFSKSFIFFLLGPFFPILIGVVAGGLGSEVAQDIDRPAIAVLMPPDDLAALNGARDDLVTQLGDRSMPVLHALPDGTPAGTASIDRLLNRGEGGKNYAAVLSGTLDHPAFTATRADVTRWQGSVTLMIQHARQGIKAPPVALDTRTVTTSEGARTTNRLMTAQLSQMVLFLLTMLLAGMVLSNLVEEKTNKIIEILAASIPIDAIFLGKLFAMLAMAFVGITVWFGTAAIVVSLSGSPLPALAAPAVGWPVFFLLAIGYFSMAYLLLGSLFLGIGGMAATVREVQTLSMPVTMAQLLVFFLATFAVAKTGQPIELFAAIFPFSSPFTMLARAAQEAAIWPHLLALVWQAFWAGMIIRIGAGLFRRNVLKSGRARVKKRGPITRLLRRAP